MSRSRILISLKAITLLALISMSPKTAKPQESNASLQDTLNWLTNFLPTATGAGSPRGLLTISSIPSSNGCNVVILKQEFNRDHPETIVITQSFTFSLSDIDPSSVQAGNLSGYFFITLNTRGEMQTVKQVTSSRSTGEQNVSYVAFGDFADKSNAQRVANALRHAAQLCAKS